MLQSIGGVKQHRAVVRQAAAQARRARDRPAAEDIGIIQDNTASPVSFGKQLREGGGIEKAGLKAVVDQIFTPPLSDATPLVDEVRSAKPDFLLLLTSAMPDCKLILEKLDEFKLGKGKIPLVGNGRKACLSASTRRTAPLPSRSGPRFRAASGGDRVRTIRRPKPQGSLGGTCPRASSAMRRAIQTRPAPSRCLGLPPVRVRAC
jgi:hypothetical protein